MSDLIANPIAASAASLLVALGWVVYLIARTIVRVELGESQHSQWPDDLTEIIADDYGEHAGRPPAWLLELAAALSPARPRRHRLVEP